MNRFALLALTLAPMATPALAQAADPAMPGMDMGTPAAVPVTAPTPVPAPAATDQPAGTDQAPGSAAPPAVVHDRAADRIYDPGAMAAAEAMMMMAPVPGYGQVRVDLAEMQFRHGQAGYRWEGEAWTGDVDRFVFRSKGEGTVGERLDSAELQAVYSHALNPWWNLQAGIRQDIRPAPARSYATIGIEGLAPYKFDVLAAAYLSDKGQVTGRIEAMFDERLTRRLVLQPRIELDLSAQDMPAQQLGAGLNNAELGLRLRYEITRQFAPYVGLSWTWATGKTADYMRAAGDSPQQRNLVVGIRAWF